MLITSLFHDHLFDYLILVFSYVLILNEDQLFYLSIVCKKDNYYGFYFLMKFFSMKIYQIRNDFFSK
jgi:hypothetical protein